MPAAAKTPQKIVRKRKSLLEEAAASTGDPFFELKNRDPEVYYVWANPGVGEVGTVAYYEANYFVPIQYSDDPATVRPVAGKFKPGEHIIVKGMVLMGIHIDDWAMIQREGINGKGGQLRAAYIDNLIGKKGRHPGEKGLDPNVFRNVRSTSTELVRER